MPPLICRFLPASTTRISSASTSAARILHEKLFYFASYEGYRQNQQVLINGEAPTQAMFGGDFSALLPNTVIYDPATLNPATGTRQAFSGNKIPSGRITSNIQWIACVLYAQDREQCRRPTTSAETGPIMFNSDQFMGRIDDSLEAEEPDFRARQLVEFADFVSRAVPRDGYILIHWTPNW